jgi:two-component system cell cycle sensor histidine kinase/response regulator CckA
MKDENKRKEQLIRELVALRRRVAGLGTSESEHDLVEKAWREKEGRCRNLFEQSTDALYMTTREGDHVEVNQSFLDLFGYTREELGYLKADALYVNPSDRIRFQHKIEESGSVSDFEVKLRKKDGKEMDCVLTAAVWKTGEGSILGYQGIIRDISDRKALLEKLRKYEFIVNTSKQFMTLINREYIYEAVNEAYCLAHGKSQEEIVGKSVADIWGKRKFKSVLKPYLDKCFTGSEIHHQKWFEFSDNEQRYFDVSYYPYYGDDSEVSHAVVITYDMTERKQAEEALRESEEKFRNLFDLSPQAIAVTDVKTGKIVDVNDEFCELTHYSRRKVLGKTIEDLGFFFEGEKDAFLNQLQESGEADGLETQFEAKDGFVISALLFARLIRIAGKEFVLTALLDMSDQKRLEAQLRQAQKMEALGTLAGGIAHNFNNLLMGIQANASLILLDIDPSDSNYDRLMNIEKMVQNGSKLTKQLLGYAREGRYEIRPMSLNQLIRETSGTFGLTKKEIEVHHDLAKDLFAIEADQGQIEQILWNLYVNAADAMPSGGDLFLKTMNVTHKDVTGKSPKVKPGDYVLVEITDTGTGMDKKTAERIFDPFFTTKEMSRGTGLGLASVYGIVRNHGGTITVTSKKGKGSTFSIYLPASKKQAVKENRGSDKFVPGKETVLLVDDEDMILDVGTQILEKMGHKVMKAKSGQEAIEIYETHRDLIELVILDMIMPGVGGGETYDRIKQINPGVKVLLSTGYSINGQATEILERGCDGFIQKPFRMKELSHKIREVLDRQ